MKIAISATGKNIDSLLDMRFGRCEYFQIHDNENSEVKVIENKGLTCSGGECAEDCQFNALAKIKDDIIIFQKLCHSCGACEIVCKSGAISYKKRETGKIEKGLLGKIKCSRGVLNVSEPMAVPIIKELLQELENDNNLKHKNIFDVLSTRAKEVLQWN